MQSDTDNRKKDKIPEKRPPPHKWTEAYKVGDMMEVDGAQMEIIKLKAMKQEIHLRYKPRLK